jgi:hypothetical protein
MGWQRRAHRLLALVCPGRRLGVGRRVGFGCAGAGVFGGSISMCSVLAWISAALAAISMSLRASSACRSAAKIRRTLGLAGSGSVANDIDRFYETALSRR